MIRWKPRNPAEREAADRVVKFIRMLRHTKGTWAGVPFDLLDWQHHEVVGPTFGSLDRSGRRMVRQFYGEVGKKNGKALDVATPVLTDAGWRTMGALEVGDLVHTADGSLTEIVAATNEFIGQAFEVAFSDRQRIVADAGHVWRVRDTHSGAAGVGTLRTTVELVEGLAARHRYAVQVPAPLERPEAILPVDPYVLGAWLGDGTTAGGSITTADAEVLEAVAGAGYPVRSSYGICYRFSGLQVALRKLGVLGRKHIPAAYLLGSADQRLALLQGLMDTDGSIGGRYAWCEFTTTIAELGQDVAFLARSLGWKATVHPGRATLRGRDCGPRWRVVFIAREGRSPFRLARKRLRLPVDRALPTRASSIFIDSIRPVGQRPVRCIQVAHPSGMFLAGEGLIPTHNSEMAAAIALYMLFADGEAMPEVYGAAVDKDQASIVFNVAAQMVRTSPVLSKRARIIDSSKRIIVTRGPSAGGFYRALPADAAGADGVNPSAVIFDEIHRYPNRELFDTLVRSTASRRQPLVFGITTAGYDRESLCWSLHEYARQVSEGVIDDASFHSVIYSAAPELDFRDPQAWKAANPSLGVTVPVDYYQREAQKAADDPTQENSFRRFHLNQWVAQETRWMPMDRWDASAGAVDPVKLARRPCFGGLDLANTSDLAAFVLCFPPLDERDFGAYRFLAHFWMPADNIADRVRRDRVPYDRWVADGLITATEGNVIDYESIWRDIQQLAMRYQLVDIAADPYNAWQMMQALERIGLVVFPFRQSFGTLGPPTKELMRLVLEGHLHHGGNPVLRWMADSTAVEQNSDGLWKPSKRKSTQRIDGVVATVMALDRAIRHLEPEEDRVLVYEERVQIGPRI